MTRPQQPSVTVYIGVETLGMEVHVFDRRAIGVAIVSARANMQTTMQRLGVTPVGAMKWHVEKRAPWINPDEPTRVSVRWRCKP